METEEDSLAVETRALQRLARIGPPPVFSPFGKGHHRARDWNGHCSMGIAFRTGIGLGAWCERTAVPGEKRSVVFGLDSQRPRTRGRTTDVYRTRRVIIRNAHGMRQQHIINGQTDGEEVAKKFLFGENENENENEKKPAASLLVSRCT